MSRAWSIARPGREGAFSVPLNASPLPGETEAVAEHMLSAVSAASRGFRENRLRERK